ncbi:hypothetical protein BCON_0316g00060 [Botryotinia convoluta]|uniref:2EXR domain-containing protein n=1 Tax=Botryotinia convoluta TaxID=54673 RepID=A0A4Z1HCT0_9HELO|nr:hypothetical protein BCON_0316g00060 [Botryotinia convoluta]
MESINPQSLSSRFLSESTIDTLSDKVFSNHSSAHQLFPTPANNVPTFPKFKLLPPELRMQVFKEAVPDRNSQVADFYFEVHMHPGKFLVSINDEISPASHLLPLLNACKLSREVVYGQLKHIRLSTPDPHGTMRKYYEGIPIRYFWANDRRLVQTYIDPVRDTLMLNIPDLMLLSHYRRSIDFSNVERLAITSFPTDSDRLIRRRMRNFPDFLDGLSTRCLDVKVLQIVSDFSVNDFAKCYRLGRRRGYHLIDIDTEMWHDNYWDNSGCLIKRSHIDRIQDVLDDAKIKEIDYLSHLRYLQEMKHEGNFKHWKSVKLTIALLCELDLDSNWETLGKKAPEPRLYCFSFDAWILAHEDGSPLNKYKGLAQIFEGAPW